ncbi:MAG TPA: prolyl oligopeptidase family serine peptidase, partial [Candidatus Cybelea sp.]
MRWLLPVLLAALCSGAAAPVAAAPTMTQVLTASFALHDLGGVNLAPAGDAVAWDESFHNPANLLHSPRYTSIYVAPLRNGKQFRLTAGSASGFYDEENPVWSPDGSKIAFLSDARSKGQSQIFVARSDGSGARQLGRLSGNAQRLTWAPDGRALAILYIPSAHRKAGALAPGARDVGVIGSTVDEQRLAIIDASSGNIRLVTPGDSYIYEYGWSPDGRQIAVTYAKGNGDNNWWIARLARVDVADGALHDLYAPALQLNDPQWSPDGKSIALIGGIMSDFGSTGGDLYLVDAQSGAARNLTDGDRFSVQSLRWNDAASLDVVAHVSGTMQLMQIDAATGKQSHPVTPGEESLWSWSTAHHGAVIALVRASFDDAPEIWAGSPDSLRQISQSNANARRLYGKAVSLQWKSDGLDVQGWLVYPLDFDANKTYPMVTMIHGGPSAETVPGFGNRNVSALCSAGYFVFMPNPRGSFGQGEAFTRANIKDFGYGDWRDDLSGVDAA